MFKWSKSLNTKKQYIVLALLVAANFIVKGLYLGQNSLAGDEPFSVFHAQMKITDIITILAEGNNPPLYEILLHFWINIFGISEFSVRVPSLIFSSITVIFIYKIGKDFFNNRIALLSSIIFIFSNYHIFFAQEARVYALLGMLAAISMYTFLSILLDYKKNCIEITSDTRFKLEGFRKYFLLAIINTLLIYAHYFGFFVLIVQSLFTLINLKFLLQNWKKLFAYASIVTLLYIPNILIVANRLVDSSSGTWLESPVGIESIYNMFWKFSNAPVVTVLVIALLLISLVKYLLLIKTEQHNTYKSFIIFWFCFIFFVMFGISYWMPMFLDRYLMTAAIAFPFLIAISTDYLFSKRKHAFILSILVSLSFVFTVKPDISNKRNVKETVAKIKALQTPNSITYFCPDLFDLNFIYYYNRTYFENARNRDKIHELLNREDVFPINDFKQVNHERIKNSNTVIYLDIKSELLFPENKVKQTLDSYYTLINEYAFYEIFNIYEYKVGKK